MKLQSFAALFMFSFQVSAQEEITLLSDSTFRATYKVYSPYYKAGMIYKDTTEAQNSTAEGLMSSVLCADDQLWVDYNTEGGAKNSDKKSLNDFEVIKSRNIELNYFQLQARLDLNYQGDDFSIMKFYIFLEEFEKPAAGALVLKNINGRWYTTSLAALTPLSSMLLVFRPEVLGRLFGGEFSNEVEQELVELLYAESLDIDGLLSRQYTEEQKAILTNPLNW